jgi:hypothetical protein
VVFVSLKINSTVSTGLYTQNAWRRFGGYEKPQSALNAFVVFFSPHFARPGRGSYGTDATQSPYSGGQNPLMLRKQLRYSRNVMRIFFAPALVVAPKSPLAQGRSLARELFCAAMPLIK